MTKENLIVRWLLLIACFAGVVGAYAWIGRGAHAELGEKPARAYYNLLVEGFRSGRLSLAKEPPAGLMQLSDPYDPSANELYRGFMFDPERLHDLSYFRGRLYLYFGVTPAVLLFWPAATFGFHVSHASAAMVFAVIGFLASAGLVIAAWRRYFAATPTWLAVLGVLAVGLTTSLPLVLQRPEVWEVAVVCGYAMMMLTLLALWRALHAERSAPWLVAASVVFGLAAGARPSLVLCAPILLIPLWRNRTDALRIPRIARLLVAALGPLAAIGTALLAYNYFRFGDALEFGQRYQLAADRQDQIRHFGWEHVWTNFRLYFLSAAGWSGDFPFFKSIPPLPLPPSHGALEVPYGILTNTPFLWLALAAPLAWRAQSETVRPALRCFVAVLAIAFAIPAVTLAFFYGSCVRYQLEFTPALVLLAVFGAFGLHGKWRGVARRVTLGAAGAALVYSSAFTLLYGWIRRANLERDYARAMLAQDRNSEALAAVNAALKIAPARGELHFMQGCALARAGQFDAGRETLARAARLDPENRVAFLDIFASELVRAALPEQAFEQLQRLAREAPDSPAVQNYLGDALAERGRTEEALRSFETVVRLDPEFADAHCSVGILHAQAGRFEPAVASLREALRLDPRQFHAHVTLGRIALAHGRADEARRHFEAALQIRPGAEAALEGLRQSGR